MALGPRHFNAATVLGTRRARGGGGGLHVCKSCHSDLVHPIQWAPVDARRWRVELRCPDCQQRTVGLFEQRELDRLDALLDEATQAMLDDLARLEQANMQEQLERLIDSLNRDLVLPEDF